MSGLQDKMKQEHAKEAFEMCAWVASSGDILTCQHAACKGLMQQQAPWPARLHGWLQYLTLWQTIFRSIMHVLGRSRTDEGEGLARRCCMRQRSSQQQRMASGDLGIVAAVQRGY